VASPGALLLEAVERGTAFGDCRQERKQLSEDRSEVPRGNACPLGELGEKILELG